MALVEGRVDRALVRLEQLLSLAKDKTAIMRIKRLTATLLIIKTGSLTIESVIKKALYSQAVWPNQLLKAL